MAVSTDYLIEELALISLTPHQLDELAGAITDRLAAKMAEAPALIDRYQLAKKLGVSVPLIERLLRDGEIPVRRIGSRTLFDVETVLTAFPAEKGGKA